MQEVWEHLAAQVGLLDFSLIGRHLLLPVSRHDNYLRLLCHASLGSHQEMQSHLLRLRRRADRERVHHGKEKRKDHHSGQEDWWLVLI